ncbi:ParB/RepB/Spo0J family partition protein [Amaricoccus sp.]|uniref:ParB/RepB/Spo0J family partition protein n=1 Tax=Amaricoccus sp. TaxID=1872485 RepID=UPI001B65770F|nr:ParB/RepB/Spo0J family partition protein [Amaricoccus sp.]MBP7242932.1 ParB-like nuclease domain-containing protein [Amaricoccus sp.]
MSRAVFVPTVAELRLDQIEVTDDRLRPVSPIAVEAIAQSIKENGLLFPLIVRRVRGSFELVDGGHRLAALLTLGREVAAVRCYEGPAGPIRQMEIDANLARADLSELDLAIHMAARRREYLAEHPETAQGIAGALGRWDASADPALASFVGLTAEITGLNKRRVYKLVSVGAVLDKVTAEKLRGAPNRLFLNDLLALGRAEPARRTEAVEAFAAGKFPKLAKALKAQGDEPAPKKDPAEQQMLALGAAWSRASAAGRKRWIADVFAQLAPMVAAEARGRHEAAAAELMQLIDEGGAE